GSWAIAPEGSAVSVAAGVPATRPQKTLTRSPGPNPAADTVTTSPGLPAVLPSIVTLPIPPGVASWAVASLPPGWATITVALDVVSLPGMVNPAVIMPSPVVRPCATTVPAPLRDVRSLTRSEALAGKPLAMTFTRPPGSARPGLST